MVLGQFGTGPFGTGQFGTGQFGEKSHFYNIFNGDEKLFFCTIIQKTFCTKLSGTELSVIVQQIVRTTLV